MFYGSYIIRLQGCAGWFESTLGAYVRRLFFYLKRPRCFPQHEKDALIPCGDNNCPDLPAWLGFLLPRYRIHGYWRSECTDLQAWAFTVCKWHKGLSLFFWFIYYYFPYFSMKTYIVDTHWKHLTFKKTYIMGTVLIKSSLPSRKHILWVLIKSLSLQENIYCGYSLKASHLQENTYYGYLLKASYLQENIYYGYILKASHLQKNIYCGYSLKTSHL